MNSQDQPIIAWNNLLSGATVNVLAGALSAETPLSRLYDADLLRPCYFTPDGAGEVVLEIIAAQPVTCAIIGAARNDPAGYIAGASAVRFDAPSAVGYGDMPYGLYGYGDTYTESVTHDLTGGQASRMLSLWPTNTKLVITFTGVVGQLSFPELFVGTPLVMPWLDKGYDPYDEVTNASIFEAESGREYARIRYRRVELAPHWGEVERELWDAVDAFREGVVELRKAFWFAWRPHTAPSEVYLVRHSDRRALFPILSAKHRSFGLKLKEVV